MLVVDSLKITRQNVRGTIPLQESRTYTFHIFDPNSEDEYKRTHPKNETGWINYLKDDYVIKEGDEGAVRRYDYYHTECYRHLRAVEGTQKFTKLFVRAGYDDFELTPYPNQYCPCESCAPWFKVTTQLGAHFIIGWRKQVIHIQWTEGFSGETIKPLPIMSPDLSFLFGDEEVTKGPTHIHAWSWEKAQAYLERIRLYTVKHN